MQQPASYNEVVVRVAAACDAPELRLTRHPVAELGLDLLRVDVVPQAPAIAHVGLFGGVHGDEPGAAVVDAQSVDGAFEALEALEAAPVQTQEEDEP